MPYSKRIIFKSMFLPFLLIASLIFLRWHYGVLLFHTVAELFSIVIGILMLVVVWNTRSFTQNYFLMYLGIGYFWIAVLDTWHTFTVQGMPFFDVVNAEPTLHFWIYARLLEALLLLSAPLFLKRKFNAQFMLYSGGALSIVIIWASFNLPQPVMLTAEGLTTFKVATEYVVMVLLCVAAVIYIRQRRQLTENVLNYLLASIALTVLAEFFFTQYTDFYGVPFVLGHLFKFLSFWMIYQAIISTTLKKPFSMMAEASNSYDAIPHAAVVVDDQGIISQLNHYAEKITGLSKEVLLHQHVHKFFHPADIPMSSCDLCEHIYKGLLLDSKVVAFRKENKWFMISLVPINSEGTSSGMIQTSTDITAQVLTGHKLEKSELLLKNVISGADLGFWNWYYQTGVHEVNDRWLAILGLGRSDIKDKVIDWSKRIHKKDRLRVEQMIQTAIEQDTPYQIEFRMQHKDGSWVWIEGSGRVLDRDIATGMPIRLCGTHQDITQRKKSSRLLEESEIRYRRLIENLKGHYFFYTHDREGIFTYVSDSVTQMLGYTVKEFLLHYEYYLTNDPINNKVSFYTKKCLKGEKQAPYVVSVYHKNGSVYYIEVTEIPVLDENDGVTGVEGIARDITDKYHAEHEKDVQQRFLQSIIDGIYDPVMVIDKDYQVKLMNSSIRKLMDTRCIADIDNPKCYEVSHHRSTPCSGKEHICPLKEVISTKKSMVVVHNHFDFEGNKQYLELSTAPLWDDKHNFIGVVESARDITGHLLIQDELREQKNILSFQANHDVLTQLPNRMLLLDRLKQSIKKAQRHKQQLAVLFIDLDHFKEINDSLGHNVGDQVLIDAAVRLKGCIRDTDTVARLGGDEFTVLIEDVYDNDIITDIAAKIIEVLQQVFAIDQHTLYVTSSIGISLYPHDAESADDLLRNADAAMYKAKDEGRNTYRFYTEDMTQKAFEHILMESNLRHALENKKLIIYYQPQVLARNNQIVGMEALVRWQHDELGLISPARFIPLAEKTGLIVPLGEQVFDLASRQIAIWMEKYQLSGRMAINLSVKQLQQDDIVATLLTILKKNKCKTQWIELEITEDYVMNNPERAIATLQQLQDSGIAIAIDDFGTGYSSLSYLKRLPINKLKIDQSFVRDIADDEDDRIIITSIISLANNMKLNVIAEGVETIEQKQFIVEQGCELIQGYYYSPPVSEKEMNELLNATDWEAL